MKDTAVELKHTPDGFSVEVLRTLEAIGFKNAMLHGGALRDHYLGLNDRIKDYDVWVNFEMDSQSVLDLPKNYFPDFIESQFSGATNIQAQDVEHTTDKNHCWTKIEFEYEDRKIDLFMTTWPYDLASKAMESDAPINSIAMDSSGKIMAHPQFAAHAQNKIYSSHDHIDVDFAASRYEHLRQKIPGLVRSTSESGQRANFDVKPIWATFEGPA